MDTVEVEGEEGILTCALTEWSVHSLQFLTQFFSWVDIPGHHTEVFAPS